MPDRVPTNCSAIGTHLYSIPAVLSSESDKSYHSFSSADSEHHCGDSGSASGKSLGCILLRSSHDTDRSEALNLCNEIIELLGTRQIQTTANEPQCNGVVER